MEKAKQAAQNFLSKDGKHVTVVDQDVRSHVTDEHVRPHEHEVVTTAVDKEVHQDHHQTRIQPIHVKEQAPETSSHVIAPVQHVEHEHEDKEQLRAKLAQDAAAFKDSSITHDTTRSSEIAPVVGGEHVHHHVHEHIQPVVHKEVVAPHTVHRTIPIHETHHASAIHHEATTLPAMTLEEFQKNNGTLKETGTHTLREFEGCPGPYDKQRNLPNTALHPDSSSIGSADAHHGHSHSHSHSSGNAVAGAGYAGAGAAATKGLSSNDRTDRLDKTQKTDLDTGVTGSTGRSSDFATDNTTSRGILKGSSGTGTTSSYNKNESMSQKVDDLLDGKSGTTSNRDTYSASSSPEKSYTTTAAGTGAGVAAAGTAASAAYAKDGAEIPRTGTISNQSGASRTSSTKKASLIDKLNPLKDADGDGKKGVFS